MASFFASQLAYILFLYGLSFILLASVCLSLMRKHESTLAWEWLGRFGLLHGINEWLDLLAVGIANPPVLSWIRFVFMMTSFFALFEFSRRSWRQLGFSSVRSIVYLFFVAALVFGAMVGAESGHAAVRYFIALPAGLWGGLALLVYRRSRHRNSKALLVAGWALAAYGLAAGLVVPGGKFFPADLLNYETFAQLTGGIPIFLVRGLLALAIAWGVWEHYLAVFRENKFGVERHEDPSIHWLAAVVMGIMALGWLGSEAAGRYSQITDDSMRKGRLEAIRDNYRQAVSNMEKVIAALAWTPELQKQLLPPAAPAKDLSRLLDRFATLVPGTVVYLLDPQGTVVASSSTDGTSFVGHSFANRPYFLTALKGTIGHQVGADGITGEAGYYLGAPVGPLSSPSHSVPSPRNILGVLAFKVPLAGMDLFRGTEDLSFLMDSRGVILAASDRSLEYSHLWPMADRERAQLIAAGAYPEILGPELIEEWDELRGTVMFRGAKYSVRALDTWDLGLKFVFFLPWKQTGFARMTVIGFTLLFAVLAIGFFISRQAEAENQFRIALSERRYRQMFEDNGAVMLLFHPTSGRIEDINAAACRYYGYSREAARELTVFDIFEGPKEKSLEAIAKVLVDGSARFEHRHRLASGELREVEVYSMPLTIREWTVLYSIVHDITERKHMEREKESIQSQLLHSEKLASIGSLAAGVGHEINNPLTIIRGFGEVLRSRLEEQADFADCVALIDKQEKAIERISKIVNGLRTYARADTTHVETINPHATIGETLSLIEQIYKKAGVEILVEAKSKSPQVSANHGKLQQVLMNLLGNAKDAMEDHESGRRIRIETFDERGEVLIRISDNGTGIAPENLKKIFEPFFTTKPPGKGTGLGLPICRSIIESFGGTLEVVSTAGAGTTFTIRLPRMTTGEAQIRAAKPKELSELSVPYKGRVLIVDDEREIRVLLRTFLEGFGMDVWEAQNGAEGLEKIEKIPFDVVIADIRMPVMSGETMIRKVIERNPEHRIKFIATSGGVLTDGAQNERAAMQDIIHGFLRKPFDRDDLVKLFRSVVAHEAGRQRPVTQ